jgi:hypothetical protein
MPGSILVLPYVVNDQARKKPFTSDMEVSAILCLAETLRKKPGILDASSERISFLSKLHYPIWVVPWRDSSLLIDGLKIFSHTIAYSKLPDIELFTEDLRKTISSKEKFRETLRKHIQTFEKPELTKVSLEAVFAEAELLSVLSQSLKQTPAMKAKRNENVALIPPRLNEKAASERARKTIDFWTQIRSEIKGLQYVLKILDEETSLAREMIHREIEHVRELYEAKITPVRLKVEKKIDRLLRKRDAQIDKLDRARERKVASRLREKRRHEHELERLERNLIEYRKRKQLSKRRGDEISASKWEHRIEVYEKKLSKTKKKLQSVTELIEQIRKQSELEIQKVKANYQLMIENEKRKVSELEASRELEVESRRRQIEEIKTTASIITKHIRRLIELKRSEASRIKEATVPHKIDAPTLLCLPFYLVRYEIKKKARYLTFPPAIATDHKGIMTRLQRALHRFSLQSRIKLLLRSKSPALERMLGKTLLEQIRKDHSLEKAVYELGVSHNILQSSDIKEYLTKGTEELRKEGWINREEKENLLKTYL